MSEKELKNLNTEVNEELVEKEDEELVEGYGCNHTSCSSATKKKCISDCIFSSAIYTCQK